MKIPFSPKYVIPFLKKANRKYWNILNYSLIFLVFLFLLPSYSSALEDNTVFGPVRYDSLKGKPSVYTGEFEKCLPATTAILRVHNGENKETRIKAADIYLNGVEVVHENEFKTTVDYIEKVVSVRDINSVQVTLKSGHKESPSRQDIPTSFVIIEIVAKGCDFIPPSITGFSPSDGAYVNDGRPEISAAYEDDPEAPSVRIDVTLLT